MAIDYPFGLLLFKNGLIIIDLFILFLFFFCFLFCFFFFLLFIFLLGVVLLFGRSSLFSISCDFNSFQLNNILSIIKIIKQRILNVLVRERRELGKWCITGVPAENQRPAASCTEYNSPERDSNSQCYIIILYLGKIFLNLGKMLLCLKWFYIFSFVAWNYHLHPSFRKIFPK
jgi:hypothetical protein